MQAGKAPNPKDSLAANNAQVNDVQNEQGEVQTDQHNGTRKNQGNGEPSGHHQNNGNFARNQPIQQNQFPQISNNFAKHNPQNQQSKQGHQDQLPPKGPNNHNAHQPPKKDVVQEPAPYTVIQSYAARLRFNQAKNIAPVTFETPKITTKQGRPAVIFKEDDFMVNSATTCRFTLIGKFSNTMPNVELLRKSFINQTQLSRGVKIAHFNSRHVYIDQDNELDYITIWTKQKNDYRGTTYEDPNLDPHL
ncbi:hypothetical protein KY290_036473 [Solanum tuberosum]|uniref:DUF4283 domain-containing protein n=1 Tax=Solanum tuberosum TaxID=4113 RepID=A0ABQ7TUB6_SOLTU|nr:hypothetical protein KY285_035773 [Solanum tuberosum]KAH0737768.1 hypothetical protein KY290_036473 [Solanum tuberosum]